MTTNHEHHEYHEHRVAEAAADEIKPGFVSPIDPALRELPQEGLRALLNVMEEARQDKEWMAIYQILDRAVLALTNTLRGQLSRRAPKTVWREFATLSDNMFLIRTVDTLVKTDPTISMREKLLREGRRRFAELIARHGGTYSTEEVAELAGTNPGTIRKRRERGRLIAFKQGNEWRFPVWQFTATGEPVEHLPEILDLLDNPDPIAQIRFFLDPDPDLGMTPIEALCKGENLDLVRLRAQQFGRHGAV